MIEKCYQLISYPQDFKQKGKQVINTNAAANFAIPQENVVVPPDQYKEFTMWK